MKDSFYNPCMLLFIGKQRVMCEDIIDDETVYGLSNSARLWQEPEKPLNIKVDDLKRCYSCGYDYPKIEMATATTCKGCNLDNNLGTSQTLVGKDRPSKYLERSKKKDMKIIKRNYKLSGGGSGNSSSKGFSVNPPQYPPPSLLRRWKNDK